MGGCRCSYRNCTVRTDGKTHMFHYPVFEKVRCHQWLVNAQRLDFLDLKVSQLRNRVICQHHFKEDCFMNYKKDKLTFEAIPTENGPFCDPSKFKNPSKEIIKPYSNIILLEDIENEIFNDKKANYSMKYGDFLTNGELTDSSSRYNFDITLSSSLSNSKVDQNQKLDLFKPRLTRLSLPSKSINKSPPQPMLVVPPYTDLSNQLNAGNEINQEMGVTNTAHSNNINDKQNSQQDDFQNRIVKKEPKIKILSAKKIQLQNPLPIVGEFKKVSPTTTLNLPSKSNIKIEESKNIRNLVLTTNSEKLNEPLHPVNLMPREEETKPGEPNNLKVVEVLNIEFDSTKTNETNNDSVQSKSIDKVSEPIEIPQIQSSPKPQKLKPKVTPERSAVIERKRKFNMKMKDVLQSCLDKLDDPMNPKETSILKPIVKEKNTIISSHLAKDQNLPNIQEYTLAYLDASMKRMERTLLHKIGQNSQQILELKDALGDTNKKKDAGKKKYVNAQTGTNEECYKKYLYKEISQYLSPSSCSLIYEELFVNKFTLNQQTSPQKRKRRKFL